MRQGSKLPPILLTLTILLALGTCYYYFGLLLPQSRRQTEARAMGVRYSYGGDFYPIWLTGNALLQQRTNPYTQEMTREIQVSLYGRTMDNRPGDYPAEYRAFSYPLYTDLLAAPLLPLGFDTVRIVLTLLLAPLTAASVVLWLRAFRIRASMLAVTIAIVLTLVSYPVLEGLYALQAGLLAAFALALSIEALSHNRFVLSGMFLALASVKPQMMWLLALALLLWAFSDWKRRKVLAISFTLSMVVLWFAAERMLPGWLSGWWHTIVQYSAYTLPPLPQLVLGNALGTVASLAMLVLAAAVAWRTRPRAATADVFVLSLSLVLTVTAILLPTGGAVYDQVILVPVVLWLWSRRAEILRANAPLRVLALAAVIALFWQWIMACAVALGSLIWPAWARSPAALVFPIRMAASLPFVVFAILSFSAVSLLRGRAHDDGTLPSREV